MPDSLDIWISAQAPAQHPVWLQGRGECVCRLKWNLNHCVQLKNFRSGKTNNKEWHSLSELNTLIYEILSGIQCKSGSSKDRTDRHQWVWEPVADLDQSMQSTSSGIGTSRCGRQALLMGPTLYSHFSSTSEDQQSDGLFLLGSCFSLWNLGLTTGFPDCGKLNGAYLLMW